MERNLQGKPDTAGLAGPQAAEAKEPCLSASQAQPTVTPFRRGVPYTPKPDFPAPAASASQRRSRWLMGAVAAVAVAGLGLGLLLANRSSSSSGANPGPVLQGRTARAEKVLLVSRNDLDTEATAKARSALQRNEVPPVLANAAPEIRQQVLSGERSLFTMRIVDSAIEDGDAVSLSLEGVPYGEVVLSHAGAQVTVALKVGSTVRLRITAVRDGGGGGVTFGATSSLGEVRTRVMSVGEYEEWTIAFK